MDIDQILELTNKLKLLLAGMSVPNPDKYSEVWKHLAFENIEGVERNVEYLKDHYGDVKC